ncbi:MAG: RodZ domain-containing protein [Spirochaetia bacterium]
MESLGEKLRIAREAKGVTLEQVARDTHIAKRFVVAMESEDFAVFPGETYLLGFLRNYAEYLSLDPDELVTLYKNIQIQEQPVPMDELLDNKGPNPFIIALIVILGVALIGGVGYLLYPVVLDAVQTMTSPADLEVPESEGGTFHLSDEGLEQRFMEGDEIIVPVRDTEYTLLVESIGNAVTLITPEGSNLIALDTQQFFDLNGDEVADVSILVSDIEEEAGAAILRIELEESEQEEPGEIEEGDTESVPSIGETTVLSRVIEPIVVLESDEAEPFTLDMAFNKHCYMRYIVDGQLREERYFNNGESFRIDVTQEIMLWLSNAGAFRARIGGETLDLGGPGEVSTRLISWQEAEGLYQLVILPVY